MLHVIKGATAFRQDRMPLFHKFMSSNKLSRVVKGDLFP